MTGLPSFVQPNNLSLFTVCSAIYHLAINATQPMRVSPIVPKRRHVSIIASRPKLGIVHLSLRRSLSGTQKSPGQANTAWSRNLWRFGIGAIIGFSPVVLYTSYTSDDNCSPLQPDAFSFFTLVSREAVSPSSSVFTLRPRAKEPNVKVYEEAWKKGLWSVQIKQPQLQIARSYTPLPHVATAEDTEPSDLNFLIRRAFKGEVSNYLHRLPIGAQIELRGPHLEFAIPNDVSEVLFLAGGTGIAPALQIVHTLLKTRPSPTSKLPKIRILWANRRRDDALELPDTFPVPSTKAIDIASLKARYRAGLSIQYFLDDQKRFITEDVLVKCLSNGSLEDRSACKKLILVSGPDGFVNYYAGPKIWKGGSELQGPLGGVLEKLNLDGWVVWKL